MGLKISFLFLLSAFLIFAQENNYRRIEQQSDVDNFSTESIFPINKVNAGSGVWIELNPKVPRVSYFGIDFINADTGWAVGGSGAIIKTTNGGDDWSIAETPVNSLLFKIHSYNGQVVIAAGFENTILRSSDGGETFEQVPSGLGNDTKFWGVQMLNDTLGWVSGMNQTLLKTTDAGLTWQQVFPGLNQHYWSLDFLNEQYGIIATGGGKVLKTTDGGDTWQQYQAGDTRALYTIDIIDSLHIAAAGEWGKNVYSSDGGETWVTNPDIPALSATNWIEFVDTDTGYSVQDGIEMRKTTNRGQSWFNPNTGNLGGEWQIELFENGTGYSAGYDLFVYKRTDGLDNWKNLFLNNSWSDVFFVNEMKGFFIMNSITVGGLYKTEDGGLSYQKVENAPGGRDLLFLDSLTGFIGSNTIYKTTDSGSNWYAANLSDTTTRIDNIFFINSTTGWAATGYPPSIPGLIMKTTDGGENWFTQLTLPTGVFTSIYFVDSLYGWASIINRRPFKTTDGGNNWIEQTNLDIWESRDVFFKDLLNGFMLESNKFYETTDGGLNWVLNSDLTGFSVGAKFSYYDSSTIFVIGYKTYRTIDGGKNWQDFAELNGILISGLSLLNPGNGYAVGQLGLIYSYVDTSIVPVELISFNATVEDNNVILSWVTVTELNNYGFEIIRFDNNGKNEREAIGFVAGHGTTTEQQQYSFVDEIFNPGIYQYRLKQIDYNGTFEYSKIIEVEIAAPTKFSLEQNYPNPFNPSTTINYSIGEKGLVTLKVYDILGKEVATLINENQEAGNYSIQFSAKGGSASGGNAYNLPSGIYFYKITSGNYAATKKLILLK